MDCQSECTSDVTIQCLPYVTSKDRFKLFLAFYPYFRLGGINYHEFSSHRMTTETLTMDRLNYSGANLYHVSDVLLTEFME